MPATGEMIVRSFFSSSSPSSPLRTALVAAAVALGLGCATAPAPVAHKYPRRGPGCTLALYRTPVPGVAAWDDLGIAEVGCNINTSQSECLRRFYAEACRMGGDMIYTLPRRPMRPTDQAVIYRGQVAHSVGTAPKPEEKDPELPPPATAEEAAGPVVPLGAAAGGTAPAGGAATLPKLRAMMPAGAPVPAVDATPAAGAAPATAPATGPAPATGNPASGGAPATGAGGEMGGR